MNVKRILINIVIIAAAFTSFVIWYNHLKKEETLPLSSVNQNYHIYLITNERQAQFWHNLNQGVSDMASLLGLTYIWEASNLSNANQQLELFNHAVNNDADAILISAVDPEGLSEAVKNAKAKGVKIIYVNTPANEKAIITLETDNYSAGKIAAASMIEELELRRVDTGKIGIVSLFSNPTINARENGFIEVIKKDGRFTVLDPVYLQGDPALAQSEAERIIKEHPDLVGLFGSNEETSEGVGNAIKADNNRITGIGFDKSDINMKLLQGDSLKAIINQNPYTMGYLGMAEAYAALKGYNTGPSYLDTGVSVIKKR
jgi:ABC-type sugar transport system, periplasmic component